MKTKIKSLIILISFAFLLSCSKSSTADPTNVWIGTWTGTTTIDAPNFDSNCAVSGSQPTSTVNLTLLITKGTSANLIDVFCNGIGSIGEYSWDASALISGNKGTGYNTNDVVFTSPFALSNKTLTVGFNIGTTTCQNNSTGAYNSQPFVWSAQLTKQ